MDCSEFNELLDLYMDGELNDTQQAELNAHADACDECRANLKATEQLRSMLSHMDDDLTMPLKAQAGWREAVRKEAHRKRMKRIYSAIGAAAAVCVLVFGVTAMLGSTTDTSGDTGHIVESGTTVIGTDGLSEDTAQEMGTSDIDASLNTVNYSAREIQTSDADEALAYLMDLVEEYDATIDYEVIDEDSAMVYLQVPADNAEDFISAVDGLGTPTDDVLTLDSEDDSVAVCVSITEGSGE